VREFVPLDPPNVSIYTCGPPFTAVPHRQLPRYVFEDLLQRHLESRGYRVHRVMNLTDVDDKTIRGAGEANVPLQSTPSHLNKLSSKISRPYGSSAQMSPGCD